MAAKPKPITAAIIQLPDPCPPDFLLPAVNALPPEITKVIAVDFGVAVPDPAKVAEIEAALETHSTCQPFSRITYLDAEGNRLGSMSSSAKGYELGDKRAFKPEHYCQGGILGMRRGGGGPLLPYRALIPGDITSPVPTKYVPPVIEPVEFVEAAPVYAHQEPSELYTDPIRILPEELASLDTPPKP